MSKYHVRVTLPGHREDPGQTIGCHHFGTRALAQDYMLRLRLAAALPVYEGIVEECSGCTTYDRVTAEVGS